MQDFYIENKIYYHDTDCGGVVYYANYLKHLEEARSEYFSSRGIDLKQMGEEGTYFVVARVELNYKAPAHYQDKIRITAKVEKLGAASLYFAQRIERGPELLLEAKTTLVCVDRQFQPKAMPPGLKDALA